MVPKSFLTFKLTHYRVLRAIDFFFYSLAVDQKNHAIGVVLSGMDSDSALGLKAIKGKGGISIVQSPESAQFPDMPRSSISADHVDMVLSPHQIAHQLALLGQKSQNLELHLLEMGAAPTGEEQFFGQILQLLRGVSGVDFRLYKPNTIRRRVARRMLMYRIDTLPQYATFLQGLVSANEEIQSANEELQSTNKELEATKEELQSSNEELQTVNDELNSRNAVLTQTSNDLLNLLNSVNSQC